MKYQKRKLYSFHIYKHPLILIDIPALLSQTCSSLSTQQIQNVYRKCGYEYGIDDCYDRP